jgi:CheY-like chemotaxis protein
MNREPIARILLVEDDGGIAHIIKLAMQDLGLPYELDMASSAEEGLSFWRRQRYDLLMTDYNLRGRNGLDLIKQLKAEGEYAPMVLFTAYDSMQLRRAAHEVPVSAYVTKPFFLDEFIDLTRSLLPTRASELGA